MGWGEVLACCWLWKVFDFKSKLNLEQTHAREECATLLEGAGGRERAEM
jgi:hypothetical protein